MKTISGIEDRFFNPSPELIDYSFWLAMAFTPLAIVSSVIAIKAGGQSMILPAWLVTHPLIVGAIIIRLSYNHIKAKRKRWRYLPTVALFAVGLFAMNVLRMV